MPITKASVVARSAAIGTRKPTTWKEQHHYDAPAKALCAHLGWDGDPDAEKNGIRVADAVTYIRKVLHEIHVAAVAVDKIATTIEQAIEHLALTDPEEIAVITQALGDAQKQEQDAAKAQ